MKEKRFTLLFSTILLFSIFLMPTVSANQVWIQSPHTEVNNVYEVDEVIGDDLYVDLVLDVAVSPFLNNLSRNATIEFQPWYHLKHNRPQIFNSSICKSSSLEAGFVFGSVNIYCENYSGEIKEEFNQSRDLFPKYLITIPPGTDEMKFFKVHFSYKLSNFVFREGNNYVLGFQSNCIPDNCRIQNWEKSVLLPSSTSVLEDISGDVRIGGRFNDRWNLKIQGGDTSFIRYYDSNEVNFNEPLKWTLVGSVLSLIFTIIGYFLRDILGKKDMVKRSRKNLVKPKDVEKFRKALVV